MKNIKPTWYNPEQDISKLPCWVCGKPIIGRAVRKHATHGRNKGKATGWAHQSCHTLYWEIK